MPSLSLLSISKTLSMALSGAKTKVENILFTCYSNLKIEMIV